MDTKPNKQTFRSQMLYLRGRCVTKSSMPKCKGRNKRNYSSCRSNRNRSNRWKTQVVHGKHTSNSGTGPKLLSCPRILHNTLRIIKGNAVTQLS